MLDVSRKAYYAWSKKPLTARQIRDKELLVHIKEIYRMSRRTYGSPRVHDDLKKLGIKCSRKRVERLMKENGLVSIHKKKFVVTTNSKHNLPVAPNILSRRFYADRPNQVWVADITYIPTREGWLYLAAIVDIYSRKVVGWAMDERMTSDLVIKALNMAIYQRRPGKGLIHHSDRGCQYAGNLYQNILKKHGIICSMSRKGDCWDNAVMESFFHTLKTELVSHRRYQLRRQAKREIFEYIEVFYNRFRSHSSIGYVSPDFYENQRKVA